jgi:hypothetical protein
MLEKLCFSELCKISDFIILESLRFYKFLFIIYFPFLTNFLTILDKISIITNIYIDVTINNEITL